ncbi:3'(2'),5'-bisphosphate nucleotidase CysQ [Pseudahrensia aquimaris]|uniref:3'(2'),5'-bisphosphate nucleotidase CysQ n=1 Tax=Pseudahrensia aquimaris TaxID=744461 RepID=A0ABW3FCD0_9HYPH
MPDAEPNRKDLKLVEELGREAGAIALSYFGKDPEVWWKEGDSPVSQADFAVDAFLKEKLLEARPDYGWLSEETEDSDERLGALRTFVVDPIDGTRGFINGMDRWCVSIAVVEDNRPVVGVLVAPVLQQTLSAALGVGTMLDGGTASVRAPTDTLIMTGPRPFLNATEDFADRAVEKTPFIPSLAWRLAMVAMGEIDVALARGSARDWDLAAADLIVHEAGGRLTDMRSKALSYNCPSTRQGSLVASNADHHDEMLDLARRAMNKQRQA